MSWVERPKGPAGPSPGHDNASGNASQTRYRGIQQPSENFQTGKYFVTGPGPEQTQQYNQPAVPQYNQQYGQIGLQQDFTANNANQFVPQYGQNYNNHSFEQNYPAQYPQIQQRQLNYTQNKCDQDVWDDNWYCSWDDSSKQNPKRDQVTNTSQMPHHQQQQTYVDNANVIEESFTTTDTWNWPRGETEEILSPNEIASVQATRVTTNLSAAFDTTSSDNTSCALDANNVSNINQSGMCGVSNEDNSFRSLNDRDVIKERMPNLALGKRSHLDNLTPQWSIESQMSQESSDGPQTHSESTYRSENQSRNSNKSSPGLNVENTTFNYQTGFDDMTTVKSDIQKTLTDDNFIEPRHYRDSPDNLTSSFHEMSIKTNRENVTLDTVEQVTDNKIVKEKIQEICVPHTDTQQVPLQSMLTTPSTLSTSTAQNPFKHIAHKSGQRGVTQANASTSTINTSVYNRESSSNSSNLNLTTPSVVNKITYQQNRLPQNYATANLETTPDNSERPDPLLTPAYRTMSLPHHMPDNLEIAPKNDRNEYLQTAHLSSADYGDVPNFSHQIPPPGLKRMVLGQQEPSLEFSQNPNLASSEPPPGLARMVPGQQTEIGGSFAQSANDYMDRHIDGQPTEGNRRNPFRQADGQQSPENHSQSVNMRSTERRPIGLDRMVPGESSNDNYMAQTQPFQNSSYGSSTEQRVVTGVDHDYIQVTNDASSEIRQQNVDGLEYIHNSMRSQARNIITAREQTVDVAIDDYNLHESGSIPDIEQRRDITMDGENLQDLSLISSTDFSFSRNLTMGGNDVEIADVGADRKIDLSDSLELPAGGSQRQSANRVNTSGDDSERDRGFKNSPKRDREKHKTDRDNNKVERQSDRRSGRNKESKQSDKENRKGDRDRRKYNDENYSPDERKYRRSTRNRRYDTEDTDYYSDRERERRRNREGSYTSSSKPPRPDDKERRYRDDRDRNRRYATIERDKRYDVDTERHVSGRLWRSERDRRREDVDRRYEDKRYRDIDPERKFGNVRRQKEEQDLRRGGELNISPSRAESVGIDRERGPTEDEMNETLTSSDSRRRGDRHRRHRRDHRDRHYDPYYDAAGYGDPYLLQRQQQTYQYYEHLRLSNPAAYMQLYNKIMAGQTVQTPGNLMNTNVAVDPLRLGAGYTEGYSYDGARDERGSVHSGRSSANGLIGKDTLRYYNMPWLPAQQADARSIRTDYSGSRDLNTDASLNLHLEESTVRSDRMTPCKFSTAHVKGSISSRHLVLVRPSYPVDGLPATVEILDLHHALINDQQRMELDAYPGPLIRGVTHKKSVIDFCEARVKATNERRSSLPNFDLSGYVLLWELLALLLRQNGLVVSTDIAELLMKNKQEYECKHLTKGQFHIGSRRGSGTSSGASRADIDEGDTSVSTPADISAVEEPPSGTSEWVRRKRIVDERATLDRYRELLLYGNKQEALEWAMSNNLWGHALQLSWWCERRIRAAVTARFLAAQPPSDPLHTLYTSLAGRQPPVATCVSDERWGDWRPHLAMILSNSSGKPEVDKRTIIQLGDSLSTRGLVYSSQFCYICAGVEWGNHPSTPLIESCGDAPPRLSLLFSSPQSTRPVNNQAIFATEIYEYACSLNDPHYNIQPFQVFKFVLATRLCDVGLYERALAYTEQLAATISRAPQLYPNTLLNKVAEFADRLRYNDPALQEVPVATAGDEMMPEQLSPHHHQQWIDDIKNIAIQRHQQYEQENHQSAATELSPASPSQPPTQPIVPDQHVYSQPHFIPQWPVEQVQQQYQQSNNSAINETYYNNQSTVDSVYDGNSLYGSSSGVIPPPLALPSGQTDDQPQNNFEYNNTYWQPEGPNNQYGYGEAQPEDEEGRERPQITMPHTGAGSGARPSFYAEYDDDRPGSANGNAKQVIKSESDNTETKTGSGGKEQGGKSSGWLGGILTKLSLKQPNQMILPDDKNPTIVWDEEHKRWRDLDANGGETDVALPPPPKMADIAQGPLSTSSPLSAPTPAPANTSTPTVPPLPSGNIFKMQRGRHIKKSYVDVFNPSGAPTRPLPPPSEVLGPAIPQSAVPNQVPTGYFVPSSYSADQQSGMYTSSPGGGDEDSYRPGI